MAHRFASLSNLSWRHWTFWFLVVLSVYFVPAMTLPLFDMDEGAYAAVSREMWLSGQWWATMLNGEPFFHKPVLMYWMQSIGLWLVGEGRFAYRLSSLVAFGLWLWFTFRFVERHIDRETAVYALWIGLFSAGTVVIFKAAIPDAWLILFISVALYKAYDYLQSKQMADLNWAFVWTGFGVLAKGPIALVVVAGSLFFLLLVKRDWKTLTTMITAWKGWLLLLLVALPWYVLQVALFGKDFIAEFFGVHNVGRFVSPMEGHTGNPLYYIIALLFLTLPFFPLLVRAVKNWWGWCKESELWTLMAIWFLLVLVFFTLAATKLPHYLMYGVPPVLIAIAYLVRRYSTSWGLGVTLMATSVFLAAVPWLIEWSLRNERNPFIFETFGHASELIPQGYFIWLALSFIVGVVLLMQRWSAKVKVIAAGLVMALTVNYAVLNYAAVLQQKPIVEAAHFVKANQIEVVTCCIEMPSFNIEAQQITPMRHAKVGEVVFSKTYVLHREYAKIDILWQGRGVAIARVVEE